LSTSYDWFKIGVDFDGEGLGLEFVEFTGHTSETYEDYVVLGDPGDDAESFEVE
jgi:hypothetical protein